MEAALKWGETRVARPGGERCPAKIELLHLYVCLYVYIYMYNKIYCTVYIYIYTYRSLANLFGLLCNLFADHYAFLSNSSRSWIPCVCGKQIAKPIPLNGVRFFGWIFHLLGDFRNILSANVPNVPCCCFKASLFFSTSWQFTIDPINPVPTTMWASFLCVRMGDSGRFFFLAIFM